MAYEQFIKQEVVDEVKYNNKRRQILYIFLAAAVLMFGFKYIAWQFPLTGAIRDVIVYYDLDEVPKVYENDDYYIILTNTNRIARFNKETNSLNYNTGYISIPDDYTKLSNFFRYKYLTILQVVAVGILFLGVAWYFYGDTTITHDDYMAGSAEARTKSAHIVSQINNVNRSNPKGGGRMPPK